MYKSGIIALLVMAAFLNSVEGGSKGIGSKCWSWGDDCASSVELWPGYSLELTCKSFVCDFSSRCWPKDKPKPEWTSKYCWWCFFSPGECEKFYKYGVPTKIGAPLPIGYKCNYPNDPTKTECHQNYYGITNSGVELSCTPDICGGPRCWPDGVELPPHSDSDFCKKCSAEEEMCPTYFHSESK